MCDECGWQLLVVSARGALCAPAMAGACWLYHWKRTLIRFDSKNRRQSARGTVYVNVQCVADKCQEHQTCDRYKVCAAGGRALCYK